MIFQNIKHFNPSVPDAPNCAKFWPLEEIARDWEIVECLRLCQQFFFIINWRWNICESTPTNTILNNLKPEYHKFHVFFTSRADCSRLKGHSIFKKGSKRPSLQDTMTSQSCAIRDQIPKSTLKKSQICDIRAFDFFNWQKSFDLTDVSSWIYDRTTVAQSFDTIHDILRSLSLAQALLKG